MESMNSVTTVTGQLYDLDKKFRALGFSERERYFLIDSLSGVIMNNDEFVRDLWKHIDDHFIIDDLYVKWGIDKEDFINRIRAMSIEQLRVITDLIELSWDVSTNPNNVEYQKVHLGKELMKKYADYIGFYQIKIGEHRF